MGALRMTDDTQERTEEATPKRQEESRKKGVVARSKDLNTALLLISTALAFMMFGHKMVGEAVAIFHIGFEIQSPLKLESSALYELLVQAANIGLSILIPIFILAILAMMIGPMLVGKIQFSSEAVQFKLERLNIVKGLAKMVSMKSLMELVKSILKILLILSVTAVLFFTFFEMLIGLTAPTIDVALSGFTYIIQKSFLVLCCSIILIAFIDVPFQLHEHQKQIKMTKQEVKDEMKETDVKPEIKNKILKIQREISRQRMMSKIPEADVIITNPTHFAVALKYEDKKMKAPVLVAKGVDHVAEKIKQVAKHHQVPIIEMPLLARAVYYNTEIDEEIPTRLYSACAQVLAYIYKLKLFKKGKSIKPVLPKNLNVPKDMVR